MSTNRISKWVNLLNSDGGPKLIDGLDLSANRTIVLGPFIAPWRSVKLKIVYTYSAGTDLTITPTGSFDGGLYASDTSEAIAAGVGTVSLYAKTFTHGGASANYFQTFGCEGLSYIKFVLSDSGAADAGDLVDVYGRALEGY